VQGKDSDTDMLLPDAQTTHATPDPRATEAGILVLLLSGGHHGIWTRSEIELEAGAGPLDVQDALAALQASGLVHLHDELVTPTRAARFLNELVEL
jgi:hypothetical protein